MSAPSPLWCANDEPHAAHRERNEFNGWNECSGRPRPPQARSNAQQAAEERYPLNGDATNIAIRATLQTGYVAGRLDALPEVPDDAVIEAMAEAIYNPVNNKSMIRWAHVIDRDKDGYRRQARAAYAAMRGAMQ